MLPTVLFGPPFYDQSFHIEPKINLVFFPRQLMMWTVYKREIMAREKEETDFLKKLFDQHKELNSKNQEDDVAKVTSYL